MDDPQIRGTIGQLVAEEHELGSNATPVIGGSSATRAVEDSREGC